MKRAFVADHDKALRRGGLVMVGRALKKECETADMVWEKGMEALPGRLCQVLEVSDDERQITVEPSSDPKRGACAIPSWSIDLCVRLV